MKKLYTLCYITKPGYILLGMKKRGFGVGHWNGFGGKVREGEGVEEAANRELEEEAGIRATVLQEKGLLDFSFEGKEDILEVRVFSAMGFLGEPEETEEMCPQWFAWEDIPYDAMWPSDRFWLPWLLAGKNFQGTVHFDAGGDIIIRQEIKEV